jgi:hypothetical protein
LCGTLIALVLVILSCDNKPVPKKASALSGVENYFNAEIKTLEESDLTLIKTIVQQGKTESITIENPDWVKELIPFTETIANQPAQIQSFLRDSSSSGDSKTLVLKARDSSATIKSITEYTTGGIRDSIVIIKKVENLYYVSSDTLTYYGKGNYLIKAENLPGLGKKIGFILQGKTAAK